MPGIEPLIALNDAVVSAELDDELVLLNVETGVYYGLNELGARVWSLLGSGHGEAEIVDRLAGEFDVERATLEADVRAFLADLAAAGLIRRAGE